MTFKSRLIGFILSASVVNLTPSLAQASGSEFSQVSDRDKFGTIEDPKNTNGPQTQGNPGFASRVSIQAERTGFSQAVRRNLGAVGVLRYKYVIETNLPFAGGCWLSPVAAGC